ncbi:hemerythrin domain-containing protein [Dysgonomonas sp. 520]|uniref:hemerythrin domain-containing protein n=1 Tax=Dysgonomonas sp. 520 TaxID=2302931 RepID=UPI0013D3DE16|nr:hemerythrin domain-containing protein [Dysgonomonas sp. 520]NDW09551.1 hemerythrin domain-containing protein [Dysgonomonas sp. 520]
MNEITIVFSKKMKMSDLIDADYKLLLLLSKLKIRLGFGEKSVEAVCEEIGFDADCFIFLANFHACRPVSNIHEIFNQLPLSPFLHYLNSSHEYFLENRLPNIRRKLDMVYSEQEQDMKTLVMNFFDNYVKEVNEHMKYEDEVAFPYIRSLLSRTQETVYSIDVFEERHNDIEEKMKDLKHILMKYVPGMKDQKLITNILMELYMCQDDLQAHTFIEEELIIPRVKSIENK